MEIGVGIFPFEVRANISAAGEDILIFIGGGEKPHIGGLCLAEPIGAPHPVTGEKPKDTGEETEKCRLRTLAATGHKDAVIAEMFAGTFCGVFGVTVSAAAGVHIDGATDEQISKLMENAKNLMEQAITAWRQNLEEQKV